MNSLPWILLLPPVPGSPRSLSIPPICARTGAAPRVINSAVNNTTDKTSTERRPGYAEAYIFHLLVLADDNRNDRCEVLRNLLNVITKRSHEEEQQSRN